MKPETTDKYDTFGRLIDKLDNYTSALDIPIPPVLAVKTLKEVLPELVAKFKKVYVETFNENPWKDHP